MTPQTIPPVEGMRREQYTLDITDVGWLDGDSEPCMPCLRIAYDGDPETLESRLEDARGDTLSADEIDVTVRLQGDEDDPETHGIVALTSRVTGDYLLEARVAAPEVITFTRAANRFGEYSDGNSRYRVRLVADQGSTLEYEKRTLLVYSHDGDLLRPHSLIPNGVEI